MKVFFKYTLAGLLALAYSISIIGVAVYHCHCSHSNQIVWLADDECECSHEHSHNNHEGACHSNCCSSHEAADENTASHCCKVEVKALHTDQDIPTTLSKFIPDLFSFLSLYQPITIISSGISTTTTSLNSIPPPLIKLKHSLLSQMAQWRL